MAEALPLIRVAASEHAILNGVAVSPQGRVFSSFPRWMHASTPSLGEALPDGTFRTFPGNQWNEWHEGLDPASHFVNVHSICADADNFLWAVDDAAPNHQPRLKGGAKVVKIDLRTNQIARAYPMDERVAPPGAVLGHMRVLGKHAFITESGHGAIIVLDQETGATRLVLRGDPKTQADRSIVPVIDGKEFRRADGQVSVVNVNLLELSLDGRWLYFTCLFGPMLRRIETKYLLDPSLSDAQRGAQIEDVTRIPPCAGFTIDGKGRIYFSAFTENAMLVMEDDRALRVLVADPRISFPNEPDIGPDGYLYFPASQIHRLPGFQADGKTRVQTPWEVLKVKLAG
ncbi:MAG TPA: L-dopachrome tautomerase-related protein [Stellaceae bacterium]|nr:L-dopachrome tautomerase-related protein [Stellaceae bacterium]